MAQRRIDLLAIEQNAWCLAACDPRCKVVGTRTELDWSMKNDQICIWAPSKILLDAVDGPTDMHADPVAMAAWFATDFCDAPELTVIGDVVALPEGVPVRVFSGRDGDLCLE
jgi:dihydroneopterin aldolase